MFDIAGYLQKFKQLAEKHTDKRLLVCEAIQTVCGIEISKTNITIKNTVVYLQTKPIIKNEIFMKKEKILNLLKEKEMNISDFV